MGHRIEVTLKPNIPDALGNKTRDRIVNNLGLPVESVTTSDVYFIDKELPESKVDELCRELFSDPVIQEYRINEPADIGDSDWLLEIGYAPGSNDIEGNIIQRPMETVEGLVFSRDEKIYTSRRYRIKAREGEVLTKDDIDKIASTLGRAPIKRWEIRYGDELEGYAMPTPKMKIAHEPEIKYIDLNVSDDELSGISDERRVALKLNEMKKILNYFSSPEIIEERKKIGLSEMPTDAELEVLGQTWSEHCKHKIFNSKITYVDSETEREINSIFDTYIKSSTETLQERLPWVVSTLWDNAGVIRLNDEWLLAIKCETHNSPSKKEPYGGAITGIVGVFRDPLGTGKGGRILYGIYGFCTGNPLYEGELVPEIANANLLEGVREGVQDGGNKHGVPTVYGYAHSHAGFMAKPAIYVGAGSLIPAEINGEPGYEKRADSGDLIVMCGGKVGIDGIHGATESSMGATEKLSSEHVQMGDPFMQKKMLEFILEARDLGYYKCITDNGAGGLSSSVGEMGFMFADKGGANGFKLDLDKVPLKYEGINPWQILISESQERMTLAVSPEKIDDLMDLAKKHEVEATVVGEFTDSEKFYVTHNGNTVTYMETDFVHKGVPQLELEAKWLTPEQRGLYEPKIKGMKDHGSFLKKILARPNICSKEYIVRQFDHEVQGTSVVKPLVGKGSDVCSDSSVIRPLLDSNEGIAVTASINSAYSEIDAYHMTANAIDEAVRRVIAVGGSLKQIPLNDNFCWPSPLPGEKDAEYKLAQLVRANEALYDFTMAYGTPCVSGKDSMSMDGNVKDRGGSDHWISAPPTLQISAAGKIDNVEKCITMDVKKPGDIVYVLGTTYDELGGSEFYEMHGEVGLNVPKVDAQNNKELYNSLSKAVDRGVVGSIHGCYRAGLGVALAQTSFAGGYGLDVDLSRVPRYVERDDKILYSESAGRFVVTVAPENREEFENLMQGGSYRQVGHVTDNDVLSITGVNGKPILQENIYELKKAWQSTFGV